MILCNDCGDPVALSKRWRSCYCGRSGGAYKHDGDHALVGGPCRVVGISNKVLYSRAECWPYDESNGKIERLAENPKRMTQRAMA